MLVLKVKEGQSVSIGDHARVTCERAPDGRLRLTSQAPHDWSRTVNHNKLYLGDHIEIELTHIGSAHLDLTFFAPQEMKILRSDAKKVD